MPAESPSGFHEVLDLPSALDSVYDVDYADPTWAAVDAREQIASFVDLEDAQDPGEGTH